MSRATIGLTFFAGMVIGLILISMLLGFCNKAWAWLNRGMEDSVDKLAAAIEDVSKESGKLLNRFLTIERGGVILFFSPTIQDLEATYNAPHRPDETFHFQRPKECPPDASCVCSCQPFGNGGLMACKQTHCRTIEGLRFYDNFRDCKDDEQDCFKNAKGGALFYNQFSFYNPASGQMDSRGPVRPKQAISIENYDGAVALCATQPCVTDADKTLIRQQNVLSRFKQAAERCATFTAERCGCAALDVIQDLQGAAKIEIDRESQDPHKTRVRLRDEARDRAVMDYELPLYLCTNEVRWEFPSPDYYVTGLDITWQSIQAEEDADDLGFDGFLPGTRRLGLMRAGDQRCFMDNGDSRGDDVILLDNGEVHRREDNAVVLPAC